MVVCGASCGLSSCGEAMWHLGWACPRGTRGVQCRSSLYFALSARLHDKQQCPVSAHVSSLDSKGKLLWEWALRVGVQMAAAVKRDPTDLICIRGGHSDTATQPKSVTSIKHAARALVQSAAQTGRGQCRGEDAAREERHPPLLSRGGGKDIYCCRRDEEASGALLYL